MKQKQGEMLPAETICTVISVQLPCILWIALRARDEGLVCDDEAALFEANGQCRVSEIVNLKLVPAGKVRENAGHDSPMASRDSPSS